MSGELVGLGRALRRAGLRVKAVDGWRTRGRPYPFTPFGTMFHHTASSRAGGAAPALGTVVHGRPGIPGPLCNILIGRDGTVYLVAAGYANHAGIGGPIRGIPENSGNKYLVGVEVENDGIGEPWTPELLRVCDIAFAVILRFLDGRSITPVNQKHHMGHKEYTTRKIDPARLNMNKDRRRVKRVLRKLRKHHGRLS